MILKHSHLICAFSSRIHGNASFCYGETKNSSNSRKDFLGGLGIDYLDLVCAKQVHSNRIRYVKDEDKGRGSLAYDSSIPGTDAFITDKKNIPLAVFTADCLSVFLFELKKPAIGLVHAGWRSTKENITVKTVELMEKEFAIKPSDLQAAFGPAIRGCCYEVGKEFVDEFSYGVERRGNSYYLDLAGINKRQLLEAGVCEANILDENICTSCRNREFFSYRKEGKDCGRMMSVIMLK